MASKEAKDILEEIIYEVFDQLDKPKEIKIYL